MTVIECEISLLLIGMMDNSTGVGELTAHPSSTPIPETHIMQGEGCAEDTFRQQLVNPKQAFLLVAIVSLGQDFKQL